MSGKDKWMAMVAKRWQPIETAPRDGSTIIVYGKPESTDTVRFRKRAVYTASWDAIDEAFCLSGGDWSGPFIEPTHWMPTPTPPSGEVE